MTVAGYESGPSAEWVFPAPVKVHLSPARRWLIRARPAAAAA